jgi:hypothetical protein
MNNFKLSDKLRSEREKKKWSKKNVHKLVCMLANTTRAFRGQKETERDQTQEEGPHRVSFTLMLRAYDRTVGIAREPDDLPVVTTTLRYFFDTCRSASWTITI